MKTQIEAGAAKLGLNQSNIKFMGNYNCISVYK